MTSKYTFQDPMTPMMYGISSLHDHILFFLFMILFIVVYVFFSILKEFCYDDMRVYDSVMDENGYEWRLLKGFYLGESVSMGRGSQAYDNSTFTSQWLTLNNGTVMEIVWTLIPSFILLLIAVPSFALLFAIDEMTVSKVIVKVVGHQWYWSYEVTGLADVAFRTASFDSYMLADSDLVKGDLRLLKTDNALILPKNMPILVLMTSEDVLHSWAVPSFGMKVDAVPGRLSQISLLIKNSGCFFGQCSELCGVNHGFMPMEVWVVDMFTYARLEVFLNQAVSF